MGRPKKNRFFCDVKGCDAGFPTSRQLGGHKAGGHKKKKKKAGRPKKKTTKKKDDGFPPIEVQSIDSNGDEIMVPIRIKIIVEVVTE